MTFIRSCAIITRMFLQVWWSWSCFGCFQNASTSRIHELAWLLAADNEYLLGFTKSSVSVHADRRWTSEILFGWRDRYVVIAPKFNHLMSPSDRPADQRVTPAFSHDPKCVKKWRKHVPHPLPTTAVGGGPVSRERNTADSPIRLAYVACSVISIP